VRGGEGWAQGGEGWPGRGRMVRGTVRGSCTGEGADVRAAREGSVAMAGGSAESGAFRRKEEENKPFIFTNQWHGG